MGWGTGDAVAHGAHGGDALDELGLAERAHHLGPVLAVHRVALHEDRRDHVVAAGVGVACQLLQQVAGGDEGVEAVALPWLELVPEVVMGIDDGELGLEGVLCRAQQAGSVQAQG